MKKIKILDVDVCITSYTAIIDEVKQSLLNKKQMSIIAINPEKIMASKKDETLIPLLNKATCQIPDGIGIVYAAKLFHQPIKERITGVDLMHEICTCATQGNNSIFLYGASEDSVTKAKARLEILHEGIQVCDYQNGYEQDDKEIIRKINESKAQILFVALGSPKQEQWVMKYKDHLNVSVIQCVGGSFDVLSGKAKRAPNWSRKLNLEWLYRLYKNPKRILRQYKLIEFMLLVWMSKTKYKNNIHNKYTFLK